MATTRSRHTARVAARRRRSQQRARAVAVLAAVAILVVLTLVFTAFGSGGDDTVEPAASSASIAAPGGRPSPLPLATLGNLLVRLPVSEDDVTGIGFHGSRDGALELQPAGRQANEGLLLRLWHRIAGGQGDGPIWYQLEGETGAATHVLDVGAFPGTDVYAPVNGTIASIMDFVIDGRKLGARIDIRPTDAPSVTLSLTHLRPDPSLSVGSVVRQSTSKIGTVVDVAAVERQALAQHAGGDGNNVAITVYPAASTLP
jgi:hypothetical protein